MFAKLKLGWKEWSELARFQALPESLRAIVFYAEGPADWAHLSPIVDALTRVKDQKVCYLTSDPNDPILGENGKSPAANPDGILPFYIGSGGPRTAAFNTMKAGAFVMTTPDLETFHLKRSKGVGHYFYVFHSMASTQMVYRKGAFDAYDTIFCVGPHHMDEIRKTEAVYGLKAKRLEKHGYGRLDLLLEARGPLEVAPPAVGESLKVLVAPSWGESSILEHCRDEVLDRLLQAGFEVTLRLHPMTQRYFPKMPAELTSKYKKYASHFRVETDMRARESLLKSHLMISEWSGAALEYGFSLERPVLFIDTPPKTNNPEFEKIGAPRLEVFIREEIGAVVSPNNLSTLVETVKKLAEDGEDYRAKIKAAREKWVYNIGTSGEVAARSIVDTVNKLQGAKS